MPSSWHFADHPGRKEVCRSPLSFLSLFSFLDKRKARTTTPPKKAFYPYRTPKIPCKNGREAPKKGDPLKEREKKQGIPFQNRERKDRLIRLAITSCDFQACMGLDSCSNSLTATVYKEGWRGHKRRRLLNMVMVVLQDNYRHAEDWGPNPAMIATHLLRVLSATLILSKNLHVLDAKSRSKSANLGKTQPKFCQDSTQIRLKIS